MKFGTYMSIYGHAYARYGEARYLKMKEHGYDGVDFSLAGTGDPFYTLPQDESDALLRHEAELAAAAGIEIYQTHGPWRWPSQDATEEDRAERMEKMKKSIRMTNVLGCKNWIIHPIMPYGTYEKGKPEAALTWELNRSFMGELLQEAKKYDVTICFENMPMRQFSMGAPSDVLRFVKEMNDDHFKMCFDTGHVSVFPDLSVADEVRACGEYIRAFHIHDNSHGADLHAFPYFGIIDWADFAQSLKDIHYDGFFSLEVTPPAKLPDDLFEEACLYLMKLSRRVVKDM